MNPNFYYQLGPPWLRIHAALRTFTPPQKGCRILTFHDVYEDQHESFARLIDYVMRHHAILRPEDVAKTAHGAAELPDSDRSPCLLTSDDRHVSDAHVG